MENKELTIEELRAQAEELEEKINAMGNEAVDDIEVESEDKFNWKKAAGVAGMATLVGGAVFFIAKKPWQAAKVVCHLVHIV